jgi:hypothetical protein
MRLVDEAGIETRLRRIRRDREFVAEDVSDENLCPWLESKRTMGGGLSGHCIMGMGPSTWLSPPTRRPWLP